jgi:hypothetical protein
MDIDEIDLDAEDACEDLDFDEDLARRQRQLAAIITGQGLISREVGLPITENPYPDWTPHSVLWLCGYTGSHFVPTTGNA